MVHIQTLKNIRNLKNISKNIKHVDLKYFMILTQNSGLVSNSGAEGRPSSKAKGTLPSFNGAKSEYSEVQNACVSLSPFRI